MFADDRRIAEKPRWNIDLSQSSTSRPSLQQVSQHTCELARSLQAARRVLGELDEAVRQILVMHVGDVVAGRRDLLRVGRRVRKLFAEAISSVLRPASAGIGLAS